MMINQEKGKKVWRKYRRNGVYSAEGLEQRVTYVIKIMFMNYKVKKIVKTMFVHIHSQFFALTQHTNIQKAPNGFGLVLTQTMTLGILLKNNVKFVRVAYILTQGSEPLTLSSEYDEYEYYAHEDDSIPYYLYFSSS